MECTHADCSWSAPACIFYSFSSIPHCPAQGKHADWQMALANRMGRWYDKGHTAARARHAVRMKRAETTF